MTSPPPEYDRRRRWRPWTLLASAALAAVIVAIAVQDGDDAAGPNAGGDRDAVAIAYVNAINTGDPGTVCRLETERQHQGETQEECVKTNDYLRNRNVKAGEPKVTQTKEFSEGVGVLVQYELATGTSPSHDALRLVEQPDGTWLVDQAESVDAEDLAVDPLSTVLGDRRETR